ncbi:MAG: hypothetical protein RR415_02510 [Ruthenibacterium sp.]
MKILRFFACPFLLLFCFSACGTAVSSSASSTIGIPNPMVAVDSAAAFEALGFAIDAPANAADVDYFIIDKTLAQVDFTLNDVKYCYRAKKTTEDISGVYENFDRAARMATAVRGDEKIDIHIKKIIGDGGGFVAAWQDGDIMHSLFAKSTVAEDVFTGVCLTLAENGAPAVENMPLYTAKAADAAAFIRKIYEDMGEDTHYKTFEILDVSVIDADSYAATHVNGVTLDEIKLTGESGLTWAQYLAQKNAQLVMAAFTYTYTDAALAAGPQYAEGENLQFSLVLQDESGNYVLVDQSMREPAAIETIS